MGVCLIVRAWNDKGQRERQVARLVVAIDDLKIQIQLAKELRVFRHFREFQAIVELVVAVGKQSGGWRRRVQGQTA